MKSQFYLQTKNPTETLISLEERIVLWNTEIIAMQPFIVHQVLILKQLLNNSTLEKTISDLFSKIDKIVEINGILHQQNRALFVENASKNIIILINSGL